MENSIQRWICAGWYPCESDAPPRTTNFDARLLIVQPCLPACWSQRLTREELDGIAPDDARYDADFFVDVIFQDDADAGAIIDDVPSHTVASPSSASIWQHVDQRKAAEPAGDGERDGALQATAAVAVAMPTNAHAIAEPASFTIEDDELGHDQDPAEQWLGKVEAFIDQPPGSQSAAHTEDRSSRDQQQPSSNTAAVDAALTAARAAADDAHAQQAARVAAMAPEAADVVVDAQTNPDVHMQHVAAPTSVQAVPPAASCVLAAETASQLPTGKTEDSFDDWLDDDEAEKPAAGAPTDAAPTSTALPGVSSTHAAAPPPPRPESDDLDDFMASLDDM